MANLSFGLLQGQTLRNFWALHEGAFSKFFVSIEAMFLVTSVACELSEWLLFSNSLWQRQHTSVSRRALNKEAMPIPY